MYDALMAAVDVSDDQKARICLRIAEADKVNDEAGLGLGLELSKCWLSTYSPMNLVMLTNNVDCYGG